MRAYGVGLCLGVVSLGSILVHQNEALLWQQGTSDIDGLPDEAAVSGGQYRDLCAVPSRGGRLRIATGVLRRLMKDPVRFLFHSTIVIRVMLFDLKQRGGLQRCVPHLCVLFLRSRGRAAVRGAARALTDSVIDHDLLVVDVVDVHDHRCGSRSQGGVVGDCCLLDLIGLARGPASLVPSEPLIS